MKTVTRAVLVGSVVAVLAACGDDGGSDDPGAAFSEAAAAICDDTSQRISDASAILTVESTPEQYADFFQRFYIPIYRERLDRLRSLTPPPGDEATIGHLLDGAGVVLDSIAADPGSFAVSADPFADLDAQWDAYGVVACGTRQRVGGG